VRDDRSYRQGVQARLLPALAAGVVVALVLWLVDDAGSGVLVGLLSFITTALLPPRAPRRDRS
jgi:hypothetical protein